MGGATSLRVGRSHTAHCSSHTSHPLFKENRAANPGPSLPSLPTDPQSCDQSPVAFLIIPPEIVQERTPLTDQLE